MKIELLFIGLTLVFSFQEQEILGTYSYGNGLHSRSIELTENNVIHEHTFDDFIGSRTRKRVAKYKVIKDSLFIYSTKRQTLLDSLYIIKSTGYLTALVPCSQVYNWEKHLKKLDSLMSISKPSNVSYLIQSFEEIRIFVRPK